jgi:hypothetical protein
MGGGKCSSASTQRCAGASNGQAMRCYVPGPTLKKGKRCNGWMREKGWRDAGINQLCYAPRAKTRRRGALSHQYERCQAAVAEVAAACSPWRAARPARAEPPGGCGARAPPAGIASWQGLGAQHLGGSRASRASRDGKSQGLRHLGCQMQRPAAAQGRSQDLGGAGALPCLTPPAGCCSPARSAPASACRPRAARRGRPGC